MKLSMKAIKEFKEIYRQQFNVELTDVEANSKGLELLEFFQNISKPIPKENEEYFLSLNVEDISSKQSMYNQVQTDNNRL